MDGYKALTLKTVYVAGGLVSFANQIALLALTGDLRQGFAYLNDGFVNIFGWVGYAIACVYYLSNIFGFGDTMCEYFGYLDYGIAYAYRFVSFSEQSCEEAEAEKDASTTTTSTTSDKISLKDQIGDHNADGVIDVKDLFGDGKGYFDAELAKLDEERAAAAKNAKSLLSLLF